VEFQRRIVAVIELLLSQEGIRPIIAYQFNHMIVITKAHPITFAQRIIPLARSHPVDKITASCIAAVLWSADHKGKAR